jgi:hypothetical protein
MLRCIIKRMVVKTQEAQDALESYMKDFDITKFPGENVPSACLWLKAVAKALGNEDLPSNVIRKVLEGFAKSLTKAFNHVCSSQIAMRHASFYKEVTKNTSLQVKLVDVLNDLENTYLKLVGGKQWQGIGHAGMNQGSSFCTTEEEKEVRVWAATNKVPWDEWVKMNAVCHHCGEKGHIHQKCPKYIANIESGKIVRLDMKDNRRLKNPTQAVGQTQGIGQNTKDPKFKAFLSAFQALFANEEEEEGDQDQGEERNDDKEDLKDDDVYGFFSVLRSLKE